MRFGYTEAREESEQSRPLVLRLLGSHAGVRGVGQELVIGGRP
jgi:hypothetical protein